MSDDVTVLFTNYQNQHDVLTIDTGADQIEWSYGLNTKSYPTYGGEVVQILSVYVDDFAISGSVASYTKLEEIYRFFLRALQTETQGAGAKAPAPYQGEGPNTFDVTAYNMQPVNFHYPARGWQFRLIPKSLPQFRYGTEVIAPTWQMTAAVHQSDRKFEDLITTNANTIIPLDSVGQSALDTFKGNVTADIGYDPNNQYQVPTDDKTHKALPAPTTSGLPQSIQGIVDFYNNTVLSSYLNNNGDITSLVPDYSAPSPSQNSSTTKHAKK